MEFVVIMVMILYFFQRVLESYEIGEEFDTIFSLERLFWLYLGGRIGVREIYWEVVVVIQGGVDSGLD